MRAVRCKGGADVTEDEQIAEWERMEREEEEQEAQRVAQYNLWVCDDGGV